MRWSLGLTPQGCPEYPQDPRVDPKVIFVTTEAYVTAFISDIWASGAIYGMQRW
jgi:hypothetical protein